MNKVAEEIVLHLYNWCKDQGNSAFTASKEKGISEQQKIMLKGKAKALKQMGSYIKDKYEANNNMRFPDFNNSVTENQP